MSIDPAITAELAQRPRLRIPAHLGVIMDGNGRWAKASGKMPYRGAYRGRQVAPQSRRVVDQLRRRTPDGIQLLVGELDTSARGSRFYFQPATQALLRLTFSA
jgi:undecaprenyl pyrophosphate synthase